MNDDNNTIPFHSVHSISYHPAGTETAGYAAEKYSEWKNPYIIYAGNGETPKKIIRKKIKKCVDSRVLQCYTTVVPGGQGKESQTRDKELEKSSKEPLDGNTRKCYNRVKETENGIRYRSWKSHFYTKPGLLTPELFKGFQTWQQHSKVLQSRHKTT